MPEIKVDVWLYGSLSVYGGKANQGSFANLQVTLPEGSTVGKLLNTLELPTEERSITFINGKLSAMPGLQPDLDHVLQNGDRIAFFDPKSMWPFQYRQGAAMTEEMARAMVSEKGYTLRHTFS